MIVDIKYMLCSGKSIAKVKDPRYDSGSRNYMLHPDLASFVKTGRVQDHFICEYNPGIPI
jgi:hypothetical protein